MSIPEDVSVGIVVPAYNAEAFIAATLDSVLEQSFSSWVCVVVDDGSTDSTAEIVTRLADRDDRIRLISQPNAGLAEARNTGIRELPDECTYVGFLDSDDLYEPTALEALLKVLLGRPDAVGAYGLADYIDSEGRPLHPGLHPSRQRYRRTAAGWRLRPVEAAADADFGVLVVGGPIWPPAVALQRLDATRAIGGFDRASGIQEDWDFYVRISRRGPYAAVDQRLAWYRRHADNATAHSAYQRTVFDQEAVRVRAYRSAENTRGQARIVNRTWRLLEARQIAVLGRQCLRWTAQGELTNAGRNLLGMLWCLSELALPGPPPASHRRLRFTRPVDHPGVELIPRSSTEPIDPSGPAQRGGPTQRGEPTQSSESSSSPIAVAVASGR